MAVDSPVDGGRWPASAVQEWIFRMAQAVPDVMADPGQILSIVVRVRGPLDVDRLDRAYDRFVARHELLRTRLVGDDDGVWQEIDAPPGASLHRTEAPLGDGAGAWGGRGPPASRIGVPFARGRPADVRELRASLLTAGEVEAVERW